MERGVITKNDQIIEDIEKFKLDFETERALGQVALDQEVSLSGRKSNKHHILFRRKVWNAEENTNYLRGQSTLMVKMDRQIHNDLHLDPDLIDGMPAISNKMAGFVLAQYQGVQGNAIASIDNLISAINSETKRKAEHPEAWIKAGREVCDLLLIQRPYIKLGQIRPRVD